MYTNSELIHPVARFFYPEGATPPPQHDREGTSNLISNKTYLGTGTRLHDTSLTGTFLMVGSGFRAAD